MELEKTHRYEPILEELKSIRLRFVSRWVVFLLDMILSVGITYATMLLVLVMTSRFFSLSIPPQVWLFLGLVFVSHSVGAFMMKTYVGTLRHSTLIDVMRIFISCLFKSFVYFATLVDLGFTYKQLMLCMILDLLLTFTMLVLYRMFWVYSYRQFFHRVADHTKQQRMLIYLHSTHPITSLNAIYERLKAYSLEGYLMFGHHKEMRIADHPVFFFCNDTIVKRIIKYRKIDCILFTDAADLNTEKDRLVGYCEKMGVKMLLMPSADIIKDGVAPVHLPSVKIEDLLGRQEIKIDMDRIAQELDDKVILVTGAAGSIGSEICRQLCCFHIKKLLLLDNAESPMHEIRLELEKRFPNVKIEAIIGSVRSRTTLERVMKSNLPYAIFHAAAYKHVPLMEEFPCEAVLTNVVGTRLVANCAVKYGVDRFVMVSTDKAVNPTNVMGATKRTAEMYVQSLGRILQQGKMEGKTRFITTRFGNVLGSNGSVIPLFRKQIEQGGPVTITHPEITRFFMTIPEACALVLEAGTIGVGNEVFVFDMGESVKIVNLAERMIELAGLEVGKDICITYTGLRPGEKLYEEILTQKEQMHQTNNEKIFRAQVSECDYHFVNQALDDLHQLALKGDTIQVVKRMKQIIPEYISNNSLFEKLDQPKVSLEPELDSQLEPESVVYQVVD